MFRALRFRPLALLAATTVAALAFADGKLPAGPSHSAQARPAGAAGTFRLVGTHPDASKQPTELGATLSILFPWHGQLYSGYGDYTTTSGPIAISPFDPASGSFKRAWVTESGTVENFRAIGDQLYAPTINSRGSADYAVGEPWKDVQAVRAAHAYDMTTLDGRDLWIVGSKGNDAVAWRSLDKGQTWKEMLRLPPYYGIGGDSASFFMAGVLGHRLYVQGNDAAGGAHPRSRVFDGTSWQEGPDLLPRGNGGWSPVSFAGQLVFHSTVFAGFLTAFDGSAAKYIVGWSTWDVALDGDGANVLYVLRSTYNYETMRFDDPVVMRTRDLDHWEALSPAAPAGAVSVAHLGGKLYVGGKAGQLFAYDGPEAWASSEVVWNHRPTIGAIEPPVSKVHIAPATILIRVFPVDPDGPVASVKVYEDLHLIGEDTKPPFIFTWPDVPAGPHTIRVRVTDGAGAFSETTTKITVVNGTNRAPTITRAPTVEPIDRFSYEPLRFRASASDADRDPITFLWDFGDGRTGTGNPVTHTYGQYGEYAVSLFVSDGRGGVAESTIDLHVDEGVPLPIFLPLAGFNMRR